MKCYLNSRSLWFTPIDCESEMAITDIYGIIASINDKDQRKN